MYSNETIEKAARDFIGGVFNKYALPFMQEQGPNATMYSLPFFVEGVLQYLTQKTDPNEAISEEVKAKAEATVQSIDGLKISEALYIVWRLLQNITWGMALNHSRRELMAKNAVANGAKSDAAK